MFVKENPDRKKKKSRKGDLNLVRLQKVTEIDISKVAQIFANLNRRRLFMLNSLLYDTNND